MINRILRAGLAAILLVLVSAGVAGEPLTEAQLNKLRTNLEKPDVGLKVVSGQTSAIISSDGSAHLTGPMKAV